MWLPLVSIILPAYNCERYIAASVASIIDQVYDNFELIIINDGSTDNTVAILNTLTDQRIRVLNNDGNKGLIYSLNRAIDEARGEYIARMDADDIAANDRIEKQVHWLLHHPDTAVVGTFINMIDEDGAEKGIWKLDRTTSTASSIRKAMVWECCLAHPTVMIRSGVLKKYKYSANQKNIEDYDLWLRLLSDNLTIEKVPQALLDYRVHASSITQEDLFAKNSFFKILQCKKKFLQNQLNHKQLGLFEFKISLSISRDIVMGVAKTFRNLLR